MFTTRKQNSSDYNNEDEKGKEEFEVISEYEKRRDKRDS